MEELSKDDLLTAISVWKTACGKDKPQGNCDKCDIVIKEIAKKLMFGELDHAMIKKLNPKPHQYISVALSGIIDIRDKDKNPSSRKLGSELITLLAKAQEDMEKKDMIDNLKDKKIDGDPS